MKKSTLITTIAMIVVVVVALSTATYAWFNTSTTNVVESSITTEAASGWLLYGGTVARSQAAATITYSATNEISLNMMNGLFSPDTATALTGTLTNAQGNDLSATFTETKFYFAKQKGQGIQPTATLDSADDNKYTHTVGTGNSAQEVDNLNVIHIVNNNSTAADCKLSILISVGTNPQTNALLAGKQFCTYIATSNETYFNTPYYMGAVASTTATRETNAVAAHNVTYSTGAGDQTAKTATSAANGYSTAAAASHFGTTNVAANTVYYIININLGNVAAYGTMNIAFYTWFDGWALDSTASSATVNVNYSFGSDFLTVVANA